MAISQRLSRRGFVLSGLGLAGVGLLSACAPTAPATKPAETKPAAPAATTAPAAAKPTEVPKPAEAAKPAARKPESKLGSQLIGKIEGAVIQAEAKRPAKLGEAPMLAELVKAGKLPSVDQRIPEEPLVVKPLREIGKYGGMWRRPFTGPADVENFNRVMGFEKPLHVDFTGYKIVPAVMKGWELRDGSKTIHLSLRKARFNRT